MKEWTIYPTIRAPMPFQMALDELLFRRYLESQNGSTPGFPLLRFYYSSEPWVTVGYSYRGPEREGEAGVTRRITGGGRVEHGKDLIFSLIAGKMEDDSFRSVRVSYWKLHEAVKAGYEALGLKPRFYRCDEPLAKGSDCFRFPIASDLAVGAGKIAGGAQKRSQGALLHQESLKIPGGLDSRELEQTVTRGFEKIFSVTLKAGRTDPRDLEEAEEKANSNEQVQTV